MIVLGAPVTPDPALLFNGASTFFLWGAALLNAHVRRSSISIVDLLIHESSHVLLFGLSANQALTRNRTDERYASPVREDKRPIDGIFHACFVTTRVHLAIGRIVECGCLGAEDTKIAVERQQHNGKAARESLDILIHHAEPTEVGEKILGALQEYWDVA
jgi:HEXXH motif-containing protein